MTARARSRTLRLPSRNRRFQRKARRPGRSGGAGPNASKTPLTTRWFRLSGALPLDTSPALVSQGCSATRGGRQPEPVATPPLSDGQAGCQVGCTLCRNGTVLRVRMFSAVGVGGHDRRLTRRVRPRRARRTRSGSRRVRTTGTRRSARRSRGVTLGAGSSVTRSMPASPPTAIRVPSGDHARPPELQNLRAGIDATSCGGPPLAGMTLIESPPRRRRSSCHRVTTPGSRVRPTRWHERRAVTAARGDDLQGARR